jgi:hypothetical protein
VDPKWCTDVVVDAVDEGGRIDDKEECGDKTALGTIVKAGGLGNVAVRHGVAAILSDDP